MTETQTLVAVEQRKPTWIDRARWFFDHIKRDWENSRKVRSAVRAMRYATEKELREMDCPWPHSEKELLMIVRALVNRQHEYGTCVYAMSMSSLATFYYVSHKLGASGFQASCADMDFLARSRDMKDGFQILDYGGLVYPQYRERYDISWEGLLVKNKDRLRERANKLLAEQDECGPHPEVKAHWERLAQA